MNRYKKLKSKKPRYIPSQPTMRRLYRKPKKKNHHEYVILLHKVGVSGISRQRAEEIIYEYRNSVTKDLETFGNLKIKNIIVPSSTLEGNDFSVEVIYPNVDTIMEKLSGKLSLHQERKLKIFKVLEDL